MKIATLIFLVSTFLLAGLIWIFVQSNYRYESQIYAEWTLADRSSTISAKRAHLDKFVANVEAAGLAGEYNALYFRTPENSFDNNFDALKTLQSRLHEIEGMDIRSFEYQTAIQQITAQEQGEAKDMLNVIEGVWQKKNYFPLWSYCGLLIFCLVGGTSAITGLVLLGVAFDQ